MTARARMRDAVAWMIRQNVQVINHSMSRPFKDHTGDGVPRVMRNDLLTIIDDAVAAGILWVNTAGNDHQRIWYGSLGVVDSAGYVDFATGDNRNYITFEGTGRDVAVELRWETAMTRLIATSTCTSTGRTRRCITLLPCVWNRQISPLLLWLGT